jgi:nucleotide-binding universal stress UspA family protein
MYDDVLVPTDGSVPAAAALDHALGVAERFDATIHGLYAIETDALAHEAPEMTLDDLSEMLRAEGEEVLDDLRERATERGLDVTASTVEGVPEDAITAYVDSGVDLVVMGTHGRHGSEPYPVGSVTDRVVHRVDVPVLVVGGA